jgi:hypothetical protein
MRIRKCVWATYCKTTISHSWNSEDNIRYFVQLSHFVTFNHVIYVGHAWALPYFAAHTHALAPGQREGEINGQTTLPVASGNSVNSVAKVTAIGTFYSFLQICLQLTVILLLRLLTSNTRSSESQKCQVSLRFLTLLSLVSGVVIVWLI